MIWNVERQWKCLSIVQKIAKKAKRQAYILVTLLLENFSEIELRFLDKITKDSAFCSYVYLCGNARAIKYLIF